METEEDENFNKPRQIDILTQQATCDNEVRPFKCSYCDRHFAKEAVCTQHELLHNGEKPYNIIVGIVISALIGHQPGIDMK